ncbi:MAG: DUF898 domain-containing protein [Gammaproteobacteria bacterium]|jgi:uncharacterized membrane protein YjgN (DUF898 family)|nr:DUF898 domain-containing protein [Gammaproteobacteria bacterium]MBU0770906.1 DUF898 domain-containing protein [Gammaproteobacteria bacterium]MBU0856812.1 DUF898 domain-containing protein [Gammaproteobacteria bacterium]MBU1845506.1 DUF898 domain-containing protein [Gammaproteobacteria bacterium]
MNNPFESSHVPQPEGNPFASAGALPQTEVLVFSGRGAEYFGIWIVNLVLTVLTLGIYSAWAKVRRMQYFYRHTTLAGAAFDYHGDPRAILKGRIIGFILLLAYNASFQFSLIAGLVVVTLLAIVMPALLMRSFRFRARNTSWRGLRFGFGGDSRGAYGVFLMWPALTLFSLYLLGPMWHQRLKRYQFDNARYGATAFSINAPVSAFYRVYGVAVAVFLLGGLAIGAFVWSLARGNPSAWIAGPFLFLALMLFIQPYLSARLQNLVWNSMRLGPHRFVSRVSARRLYAIMLTNLIGVVCTLGLFQPFAAIRLARYRLESVTMVCDGSLDDFVAGQSQDVAAIGEETADLFDVDIAL